MKITDSIPARSPSTASSSPASGSEAPTPAGGASPRLDAYERVAKEGDPSLWKILRDRVMGDVAPPGVSDGAGAAEALVEIQKSDLPMKMTTDHLQAIVYDPTLDSATQRRALRLLESANKVSGGDVGHALQWQQEHAGELQAVLGEARSQGWDY